MNDIYLWAQFIACTIAGIFAGWEARRRWELRQPQMVGDRAWLKSRVKYISNYLGRYMATLIGRGEASVTLTRGFEDWLRREFGIDEGPNRDPFARMDHWRKGKATETPVSRTVAASKTDQPLKSEALQAQEEGP